MIASLAGEDVPDDAQAQWRRDLDVMISAAREASDALDRRLPRIELLFERQSPTARSCYLAYMQLDGVLHSLPAEHARWGLAERDKARVGLRKADHMLDEFGRRARAAILASPWTVRPIVARAKTLGRRLRTKSLDDQGRSAGPAK